MRAFQRPPDFLIGDPSDPYLRRWHMIPRNRWLNVYLHHIRRSDDDRALHDHPWHSASVVLKGEYLEVTERRRRVYRAGSVIFRRATHAHRLVLHRPVAAWTLFITGPHRREWGFHCPQGWVHWQEFVGTNAGEVGRGCGEVHG